MGIVVEFGHGKEGEQIQIQQCMSRQSWSTEEDSAICRLVGEFGLNDWTKIAEKLRENYGICKRTGKQCRQRWYNHLNPAVNKKPWDEQEEGRLFALHRAHGNRWKDISRHFLGRTDNDIKNHFYSTLRRSLRRLNKISGEKNSTSQMREIKPSVLSTIMNHIYDHAHLQDDDLLRTLRDLPSLIFDFANFKPVKNNLRGSNLDQAKDRISQIFALIARFNKEYERSKLIKHNQKRKRQVKKQAYQTILQFSVTGNGQQLAPKICSETTLRQASPIQSDQQQSCQYEVKLEYCSSEINELEHKGKLRAMSLQAEDVEQASMPAMQEPEVLSIMAEQSGLDLTVVGKHWSPQSWERESDLKIFVDEVLQINYDQ